ncbi:hypothetical protein D3C81_1823350 [compost metagenome]
MNRGTVAVICLFISLTWCKVQASCDLLIKQNILHRMQNIRIKADGKFTDMSCTLIRIQNIVQALRIIACCLNDFPVLKGEFDVLKSNPIVQCRGIVADRSVDRIANRGTVNFTVRNIFLARAFFRSDSFD